MQVNINIGVDVVGALSDQTLHQHIFIMDDSIFGSAGQGTENLATACQPGQIIQWKVYAIDLQTPVSIKNITFLGAAHFDDGGDASAGEIDPTYVNPDLNSWTGIVPCYMTPGYPYRYKLELQMGNGEYATLSADTPSLVRIN